MSRTIKLYEPSGKGEGDSGVGKYPSHMYDNGKNTRHRRSTLLDRESVDTCFLIALHVGIVSELTLPLGRRSREFLRSSSSGADQKGLSPRTIATKLMDSRKAVVIPT